ncbi:uncharacterized protein LOC100373965 [Saccoglossus kowalevskii]
MASKRNFVRPARSFSPILSSLLKEARVTHPDEMRGASRQKQNALMHKQISTFEKLVQHGMSKFSKDKLHRMLTDLVPIDTKVTSFGELKQLVENVGKTGSYSDGVTVAKYFTAFLNDIEYLRKMKAHFDERIYSVLYEFYYDPVVEDVISVKRDMGTNAKHSRRKAEILRRLNQAQNLPGVPSFNELAEESENLSLAMAELKDLDQQWQMLLDDDEVDGNLFDDESSQELLSFANYNHFEHVFRFVPDVLLKSYNAIELAKRWLVSAEKINNMLYKEKRVNDNGTADDNAKLDDEGQISVDKYVDLEDPRNHDNMDSGNEAGDEEDDNNSVAISNDSENISDMIHELEERLRDLIRSINRHEDDLQVHQDDLERLINREARVGQLAGHLEKTVTNKESILVRIQQANEQKDELMDKIRRVKRDSVQYRDLYGKLAKLDENLTELEYSSHYHNYEHNILVGDLNVELEVQPSMIRFVGDVQDKINQLQTWLLEKKSEKRRVEKELVLLRNSTDDVGRSPIETDPSRPTSSELEMLRPKTSDTVIISRADPKTRTRPTAGGNSDPDKLKLDAKDAGNGELRPKPKIHHRKTESGGGNQKDSPKLSNNNDTKRKNENVGDNTIDKTSAAAPKYSTFLTDNTSEISDTIEFTKARVHPRNQKPEDIGKSQRTKVSPPANTSQPRRGSRIPVRS